jgi:hypothetical protein
MGNENLLIWLLPRKRIARKTVIWNKFDIRWNKLDPISSRSVRRCARLSLHVADRDLQVVEILLQLSILLGHLLILALPLITGRFESLHLAFVVASLDVGLAKPSISESAKSTS